MKNENNPAMVRTSDMQSQLNEWSRRNFGNEKENPAYRCLLGAVEEIGELAHAHLKQEQGIRIEENHEENAQDAVGDTVVYLMDYCNKRGWSFEDILNETWAKVIKRDWTEDKTGKDKV